MQESQFFKKLPANKVKCLLCNHFCDIAPEKIGICRSRKNENGILKSMVYGHPFDANIDPIEKKPLFHFLPGTNTYSIGTLGCNFTCVNCQNWNISQAKKIEEQNNDLPFLSPEKIVEDCLNSDCTSIAYTYNEPTMFADYALDIMKLAHANKLKNVWVSNGYMSDICLDAILPYLDAINVDLKSFDEKFYRESCSAKLQPILDNLKRLKEQTHLEITTLIIPSLTYNEDMLIDLANFIVDELGADTPWHITKFSSSISWKLQDSHSTSTEMIYNTYEIGKTAGLKYVYVGNLPGDDKENTYCPKCGELAIQRIDYEVERFDDNGECAHCGKNLDIID
ncbi:AmmeMemoRadiSam system radical SAM enzyme [Candidatus Falkowbacteria bacterium RIFOXYB2_FULL_34_18]|uniref:AmmeMemoRadiSam system radical SAM enzyme n=1 Tax=Candidatus Falkowbacteria bacterium RIFOXYD2_FULL_34_120 TaxID=1798007 RepID=A0A1F5TQF7_9BACT|nr:MAG: AmmeMemoRadiSam system radical SAM enzyme [Candidatus Falkowbacteria bacterium RIFOXYB2_FULL_34_18]OGF29389.1 MAG: AmmeMemoRadiSam system radical SAM enzyme [Candidatus Falkowbacteria bacterium RIFOXYC12_FULL_34_55]OGF36598.1 MAG: AmmeMemoRadiSam system radical SAM enzyme [Candidatus Falkowbacteria bacterium RIFOXYC2_FULL_34_220]OGF38816.1 MAG: AmmeMemoRadiSam system radical SAM enzyme [Candidatus Falkowbacteria bacterium RIFOXYD12_FULL_34_57]OGF41079.1 MAG: AmmeMemoRadiSam system radic